MTQFARTLIQPGLDNSFLFFLYFTLLLELKYIVAIFAEYMTTTDQFCISKYH